MGDFVLDGENIGQVAVVAIGPDVTVILAINELPGDADTRARLSDATFHNKLDPELSRYFRHLHRLALIGKNRVARDD